MRVLIADDQPDVRKALAELVRCCNHEVVAVVGSGLEAINAYSLHHPDLVLMDYRMPKLNGGTACRHIIARDPAARIILVSAWSPLNGADESGAISFLSKPVDLERLSATLQTVAQMLPAPAPAENVDEPSHASAMLEPCAPDPIPEIYFPPESIEPLAEPELPEAVPELEPSAEPEPLAEFAPVAEFAPLPEPVLLHLDPACLEIVLTADATSGHPQPAPETCALNEQKIKRRPSRRRAPPGS